MSAFEKAWFVGSGVVLALGFVALLRREADGSRGIAKSFLSTLLIGAGSSGVGGGVALASEHRSTGGAILVGATFLVPSAAILIATYRATGGSRRAERFVAYMGRASVSVAAVWGTIVIFHQYGEKGFGNAIAVPGFLLAIVTPMWQRAEEQVTKGENLGEVAEDAIALMRKQGNLDLVRASADIEAAFSAAADKAISDAVAALEAAGQKPLADDLKLRGR